MSLRLKMFAALLIVAPVEPAAARNIVIANDDGLTANVKALYDALKADGHDVIVALPCTQQSGMGGALKFMTPLAPLATDCAKGAARAGEPGAGPMTREGLASDFYYVDGTPVMALLYGLDVVAEKRWGKAPDLVLSGPNVGLNAGNIVVSSGTVSNVQYALMRGIPAVALSAGEKSGIGIDLANPYSTMVAKRSIELLNQLEKASRGDALLPPETGLNVNFPDELDAAPFRFARNGGYMSFEVKFVEDLPAALGRPAAGLPLPGLFGRLSDAAPAADQQQDEAVVAQRAISVSVIQIAYDAPKAKRERARERLKSLFASPR